MLTYAVELDGRWRLVDVAPGTMIAFEDEFGKSVPDGPDGTQMWRHVAWIAHKVIAPDAPFDEWVSGLTDLTGDDERIAEIRAELTPTDASPAPDPTRLRAAGEAG